MAASGEDWEGEAAAQLEGLALNDGGVEEQKAAAGGEEEAAAPAEQG